MSQQDAPRISGRRYVRAVTPGLRRLLYVLFGVFALMALNGLYLATVTCLEWASDATIQNYFYLWMFLLHVAVGLAMIIPVLVFGVLHIRNAHDRPNRRAVMAGYGLFATAILLMASGVVLTRIEGIVEVNSPAARTVAYWIHVFSPLVLVWAYVLHRLVGPRIKWRIGLTWTVLACGFAIFMGLLHSQDPRKWNEIGPASGERYFFPSLSRTATGNFIPAETMMMDEYCKQCHPSAHETWTHSVHRFASFNNPVYRFSVRNTRRKALERDGDVQASRFCAGCHDPVVLFSGAFDDPEFDDESDPSAQAGITCTICHAITNINSPRGNGDYTIEEPVHYPFARSESPLLSWVNRQLIRGKPALHKKTFLKPLHKTAEFCGTCHKVHLPEELNKYRFLRGQNHYDSHLMSGVSGHGIASFYYPDKAEPDCNGCHMPLLPSDDVAAKDFDGSGALKVHDHLFPSANTAVPYLLGAPASVIESHRTFNDGVMRLDLFGLKRDGRIDGELIAPLRPELPVLEPGATYLLEAVIRTLKMGHSFTQGTADSNEVWLDVTMKLDGRVIGRSGGVDDEGRVDPWSHFVNVYMLDRHGDRIDRRNAEDIFIPLYDHQIPPGAADVIHYRFKLPRDVAAGQLTIEAALRYRKFDSTLVKHFDPRRPVNDLPVLTLATDSIALAVGDAETGIARRPEIPEWERFNDYGIGLLRKGNEGSQRGELKQAEAAFKAVERLGHASGPLNRARVYLKEGRLDEAVEALKRAARHQPPAPPWSIAWFSGLVDRQNGNFEAAIEQFQRIIATSFEDARRRGFDFSRDTRVRSELGQALIERSQRERGRTRREARDRLLEEARLSFQAVLEIDPENVRAHYNLFWIAQKLGETEVARRHQALHQKYKPDDNARDKAVTAARARDPAADHAADAVVIYDLQRDGAFLRSVLEFAGRRAS